MAMAKTSGLPEPNVNRYGLSQIYAPEGGGLVDVVFVHGLNGDPHQTWTSEKKKTFWPYALLPQAVEEVRARILVYGYDADVVSFTDGTSKDKIHNHAESLVAVLAANRRLRKASERPIIFVAHSLGGLVVKRALIYSSEIRGNNTEHLRGIFVSTYGVLFLGTPHYGADVAQWGSRLEWICGAVLPSKILDSQPQLVDALKKNNETLQNIDRAFIQMMSRFHIFFFHEAKPTKLGLQLRFIVDEDSASPNVQDVERAGIPADHSHMCKFEDDSAPGFDIVAEAIMRYAGDAPDVIRQRWNAEKTESLAKRQAQIQEIIPGSIAGTPHSDSTSTMSHTPANSGILPPKESTKSEMKDSATNTPALHSKPTEPYFIVPPGFRRNTYFVGMDKELLELDRRLFDKRRLVGTAAVLLHGQAGGGKSHLARQYIYGENRKKFTGGIYWIPARSREERHQHFWNIKQKVVDRETDIPENEQTVDDYVPLVKAWFEAHDNWLIIFDGITVESDEDAVDLADFIPDNKDCSIIYVSRAKNLESRQRLLRPYPLKVGPLKEEEAKKLLFKELHIRKPTEVEKNKATDLVKKVGGLPLAIDAISRRIADTHEPLAKYKLSYSGDATLQNTYNVIFDDLRRLGHWEALNLIHILCWFAQDLPVEMVHLGLRILQAEKLEVRATEMGSRPDINTTFGELMRYALIERNEPSDSDSISSSRDSLSGPEPIDMVKIHTVVQSFCCDSLNTTGQLPQWLGYAVKLFSYSYDQADVRIRSKPDPGRVSDYRWYKVHGQRLWDHTVFYENRTQVLESIREELRPVIVRIDEEIHQRQPNSSQESLSNGVFQISIFDRTSSSSDDSIPGPRTPNYRPTPPPLVSENQYGFPKSKPPIDSPGSFGTATPRREAHVFGLDYDEPGYESDREGHAASYPMGRNPSDMTARPPPRTRAPTRESQNEGWQFVQSSRKPKKPARRDLGSFRPRPARAQVDTSTVTRKEEERKPHRRESSPALKSLQRVHSQSPSPPRSGIASLFHRAPREPTTTVTQPTWASVAAGKTRETSQPGINPSAGPQAGPSITPTFLERGRSRESSKSRQGNAQPSPLASEFVPYPMPPGLETSSTNPTNSGYPSSLPPAGFQSNAPYPRYTSSLTQILQGRPVDMNFPPYQTLPPLGPTLAPLPIDEGITITSKRPLPTEFPEVSPPQPAHTPHSNQPSPLNRASPYQQPPYDAPYPLSVMPAGYYSQPMSRDHSHQSHGSIAETEPTRFPSTESPLLPPVNTLARERYPDGRAFSKSPKTGFVMPAYPQTPSSRVSPYEISHTGGWTSVSPPPTSYDVTMSRSSSSPGLAVQGTPGGIVPFEIPGVLQFGEHPPVSVAEARRRAEEQALKLRERQREIEVLREMSEERHRRHQIEQLERARMESAPYPNVNLIPTISNNDDLQEMIGGGGRSRGLSAPEMEGLVGLGVRVPGRNLDY